MTTMGPTDITYSAAVVQTVEGGSEVSQSVRGGREGGREGGSVSLGHGHYGMFAKMTIGKFVVGERAKSRTTRLKLTPE